MAGEIERKDTERILERHKDFDADVAREALRKRMLRSGDAKIDPVTGQYDVTVSTSDEGFREGPRDK